MNARQRRTSIRRFARITNMTSEQAKRYVANYVRDREQRRAKQSTASN